MTDARLPERWLTDRRLLLLTDAEHRFYITALLWCVANRTDGEFGAEDIRLMPGIDPGQASRLAAGCAKRGLLAGNGGQWVITGFAATQSSRDELDQLDRIRAAERDKKRRYRLSTGQSTGQSTGTALGQARQARQDRLASKEGAAADVDARELPPW